MQLLSNKYKDVFADVYKTGWSLPPPPSWEWVSRESGEGFHCECDGGPVHQLNSREQHISCVRELKSDENQLCTPPVPAAVREEKFT